ncbi:hypothetical protein ASF10_20145 [Flavobacterium sp. Leaf82]|jgi:hypothetical protein|uniref:hypothetical protein n=1 Tax=unclassified Flavobacterium TaxID=196869 RepID=UPI0006F7A384|nr:hypothetical protein [Flavobacterium sp. Leaf82]KQO32769.1 hypothetical protein ASF10_20145 [Flavobacterium sp. Leaf82]
MNKSIIVLVLLIVFCKKTYAQNDPNLILGKEDESELSFHVYDSLIIKKDYLKLEEVKNDTPENLMRSILSASSQEWIDYNTLGGSIKSSKRKEDYFVKIKQMSIDKNYIKLIHKVSLLINNTPTEIIKFYFKQENTKDVSGCYVLQKVNDRWYKVSNNTTSNLSIIVMRLKTNVLIELFSGKTSNILTKELYNAINSGGYMDLSKLENIFFSWYSPLKKNEKLNLFIDSKTW